MPKVLRWLAVTIVGCTPTSANIRPPAVSAASESGVQPRAESGASVSVAVSETVELALVIAALTAAPAIRRDTEYFDSIAAHFAPHAAHRVISSLGNDFNLPRFVGNAADFAFGEGAELTEIDASGSLWQDPAHDLFRNNLAAVRDFARVSQFRTFYAAHAELYAELTRSTLAAADVAAMHGWLEANFTARPGATRVFVSPLMAGHHWTTMFKPEHRLWVSGPRDGAASPYDRAIFTELDHPFINPVTARYPEAVRRAMAAPQVWVDDRAAAAYPTAELQFNEYMTWAAYLMYAEIDSTQTAAVTTFMAERRGFVRFPEFASEAVTRYRAQATPYAETLVPEMMKWCAEMGAAPD